MGHNCGTIYKTNKWKFRKGLVELFRVYDRETASKIMKIINFFSLYVDGNHFYWISYDYDDEDYNISSNICTLIFKLFGEDPDEDYKGDDFFDMLYGCSKSFDFKTMDDFKNSNI